MKPGPKLGIVVVALALNALAPFAAYAVQPRGIGEGDLCSVSGKPRGYVTRPLGFPRPQTGHYLHVHCALCAWGLATPALLSSTSALALLVRTGIVTVPAAPGAAPCAEPTVIPPSRGPPPVLIDA